MASPDNFSVASGQTIYGGRAPIVAGGGSVPGSGGSVDILSLVPAPGMLKSIHANSLSSLNPCPGNQCWYTEADGMNGPWTLWTGGVFAEDYSEYGAMVYWGGGHAGYDGTEFYIFDLTTQLWSRLNAPLPANYLASVDTAWSDYTDPATGQIVVPATHTYSLPVYISAANGGGPKGSWCLPYNVYENTGGFQPHMCDLATGVWKRMTTNTYNVGFGGGPYGGAFVDKRGVLWAMPGYGTNTHAKIDTRITPMTVQAVGGFYAPGYYFVPCYVPEKDTMVSVYIDYGQTALKIAQYDLSSGSMVEVPPSSYTKANSAVGRGPGLATEWNPDTGKFYVYEGGKDQATHVVTPPAGDWKTGVWTFSKETMGGEVVVDTSEVRVGGSGGSPFSKWKYNRKLKCFMWSQGTCVRPSPDGVARSGAFQLYKALGT